MFSRKVCDELKWYVYLYIDPRNGEPFYIGKGKGKRAFVHLKDLRKSDRTNRIAELQKLKLKPTIELLKYGLRTMKRYW